MIVCDSASGCGVSSPLLSCDKSQSCLADATPKEGFRTAEFPMEALSLGRGRLKKASPSIWCFFLCMQLKIISIPKQHILGWDVLNPYKHILGWHILLPLGGSF